MLSTIHHRRARAGDRLLTAGLALIGSCANSSPEAPAPRSASLASQRVVAARADPYQGMKFYYGDTHFHSGFSGDNRDDGPPLQAFLQAHASTAAHGRDPAFGGDDTTDLGGYFLFLSDHAQYVPTRQHADNDDYLVMSAQADDPRVEQRGPSYTFTALAGVELTGMRRSGWGHFPWDDQFGHINVFGAPHISDLVENHLLWNRSGTDVMDSLARKPQVIAQFNHSGYGGQPRIGDDLEHLYNYSAARARVLKLFEVSDGRRKHWNTGVAQYNVCLSKGYCVAPVIGTDTHDTKLALSFVSDSHHQNTTARTVIIGPPTLGEPVVQRRAMLLAQARRGMVYATEDSNLQIRWSIDGVPMGSSLPAGSGETSHTLTLEVRDPACAARAHRAREDSCGIESIELVRDKAPRAADQHVSNAAQITKAIKRWVADERDRPFAIAPNTTLFAAELTLSAAELTDAKYLYLTVTQLDGDRAITAPVYLGARCD